MMTMLALYRCLLHLYPIDYRREYAHEMASVFCELHDSLNSQTPWVWIVFCSREILGLLSGALGEHFRRIGFATDLFSFRRFDMRREFRFARSSVFLMSIVLALVLFIFATANSIQMKYAAGAKVESVWAMLPSALAYGLLILCALVGIVQGILYALRQTGAQRAGEPGALAGQEVNRGTHPRCFVGSCSGWRARSPRARHSSLRVNGR